MSSSIASIRFGIDQRTARAVQRHPRLVALLPDKVEELVLAFDTSKATATAVSSLKVETVDLASELDAEMRAGRQPDAAKLVAKYAAAQRKAEEIRGVVAQLSEQPGRYLADIVRVVEDAVTTMPDDLADQLDDVLDRGEALLADLGSVSSADQAVDADKIAEWKALKALAAEYQDIRDAHLSLLRAEDTRNFSPGSLGVALAFFRTIEDFVPALADRLANGTASPFGVGFTREGLPFAVTDHQDLAHFLNVLRHRDALHPHVARPEEIAERRAAAHAEGEPAGVAPEQGRLSREWGGNESAARNSHIARKARSQATIATPKVPQPFDGPGFGHHR